jgi:uracil-DNA glycosylase
MPLDVKINPEWKEVLKDYFETENFGNLTDFIKSQYQTKVVYPSAVNIFKAFDLTPFSKVKVVILGQDPYHGAGQAQGLSFSVPTGTKLPPSLQNIYKEIEKEFGIKKDFSDGNLESWAGQGVFLLNSILTVIASTPASHQKKGWEEFTDLVISTISDQKENVVFMLWGNFARSKKTLINGDKHLILEAPHPSPFSAHSGFFGCNHFKQCNEYLESKGLEPIIW